MDKEKLLESIRKDRRSPGQVFESLRQKIIVLSDGKISDEEATQAARNLINVFEIALEIPPEKRSFFLEQKKEKC